MNTTTNDNAIVSAEQVKKATATLKKVLESLKMASLTPAERIEYRTKRGNRFSLHGLEEGLAEARQAQDLLPPTFDLPKYEHDTNLARALFDCLELAETIRARLKDTLLMVGSWSAQAGAIAATHIKVASRHRSTRKRTPRTAPDASDAADTPVAGAPSPSTTPSAPPAAAAASATPEPANPGPGAAPDPAKRAA